MPVLIITQWILLHLLAHIKFTASQNLTVLVHFGYGPDPASVLAADSNGATYWVTYTNICRSGPCSPLTIITNIIVQGQSTAGLTHYAGDEDVTFACVVTSSLSTGSCTYAGTYRGSVQPNSTSPLGWSTFWVSVLTVTAGQEKLSSISVSTTHGVLSSGITVSIAPTSSTSTSAAPASSGLISTPPASSPSTNTPSTSTQSASATSAVGLGSTAANGKNSIAR